jgi:hypothetical protein
MCSIFIGGDVLPSLRHNSGERVERGTPYLGSRLGPKLRLPDIHWRKFRPLMIRLTLGVL